MEVHLYSRRYRQGQHPIAVKTRPAPGPAVNPRLASALSVIGYTRSWTGNRTVDAETVIRRWLGLAEGHFPNDREFERGVSVLLFALGIPTTMLPGAEGVDHVAVVEDDEPVAVLLSCTTAAGSIEDKVRLLADQRDEVMKKCRGVKVAAAIVAPVDPEHKEVRKARADCDRHNIKLLLHPDIRSLFDAASSVYPENGRKQFLALVTGTSPGEIGF